MSTIAVAALLAAALPPAPAVGADSPSTTAAQRVTGAVSQLESARANQANTRARSDALASRISALKRQKGRGQLGAASELDALLRESVAADDELKASDHAVDQAAASVRSSVGEAVAAIDREIRSLAPKIKEGSLDERRAAARRINELRESRRALKDVIARLETTSAVPPEWSKYAVKIEPLDGPSELSEKADFVEDTRDKLKKKRDEIARLIKEAHEEQELLKAGSDFRTDARHFDEEARAARRVPRVAGADQSATQSFNKDARTEAAPGRTAADHATPTASTMPPTGNFMPGGGPAGVTPPPAGPATPSTMSGGADPTHAAPPAAGTPPAGGAATAFAVPQPTGAASVNTLIDPSALLNLKVETLEGASADLATLQSLATNLDRLERFLAVQAAEIRRRAAELERNEERQSGRPR